MKKLITYLVMAVSLALPTLVSSQGSSPAPYCNGGYTSGNCLQGGPTNTQGNSVNDFIDIFKTSGGNTNINNSNSGCNGNPNNYANYCQHYLQVSPGQVITCTLQSGIIYSQGFAIWIDWNQDNVFQNPGEQVAATSNVPPAATQTILTFSIPPTVANGTYRMRVRCAFATPGTNITPCGTFGFGETEDYSIYVGPVPASGGIITATAVAVQSIVCVGQALSFSVTTPYTGPLSYTWTGPSSFSSTSSYATLPSASLASQGVYTVVVSNTACPVTRTVQANVVAYPNINTVPNSHTICQGGNLIANVNVPGAVTLYTYQWLGPGGIASQFAPSTPVTPPLLPAAVTQSVLVYSVLVTPTVYACTSMATMSVTINNPMTPTLALPGPQCNANPPFQLFATPGGGTWSAAGNALTPGGIFTPTLTPANGAFNVQYSVSVGNCVASISGSIEVSKYHPAILTSGIAQRCSLDPSYYLMNIVQDTTSPFRSWAGTNVMNGKWFVSAGLPSGNYTLTFNNPSDPNPNVCPTTTTIVVPVFNPPTPTIAAISPVCTNGAPVQLTAQPPGGAWSGNSGISVTGVLTPSNCGTGLNSLVYTAGQNTCTASSSRTFEVSRFNPAIVTGTVPAFCANSAPFNLNSIVQFTGGVWAGISVMNNAFSPAGLPTNTYGLTYHTLSSPNTTLCPDSSRIYASVLNPPTPVIQVTGPYCQRDAAVQLTVSPGGGQWSTAPYLTASGVFIPSLSAVGNNFVQYAIGNSTCNIKSSILINVEAFVPATITGKIPDLCNNSPVVSLAPLSTAGGNWTGTGISGGNFNPAVSNAGLFYLVHNTSSTPSGLCPDHDSIAVNVYSLAPPYIAQAGPFCSNSKPFQLEVSPLGGIFDGTNTKAVSNEGIFSPYTGVIGKNVVSYSISSGPCIAYAQTTIMVEQFVSAQLDAQPPAILCINADPIDMMAYVQNRSGFWSGPGMYNGSSMFYPKMANTGPNNVLRYYTHSAGSALRCPDESSVQIIVRDIPKASIVSSTLSGCAPHQVTFSSPENQTGKGLWVFDDGTTNTGFSSTHVFARSGKYNILYRYEDTEAPGCSTQVKLSAPVNVLARPRADFDFSSDEVTIVDPQVTLINRTNPVGDNKYVWTIFGMEQYYSVNPLITFPKAGNYRVNLEATNYNGCKSEITKLIEVKNDFNVFIPNSFTPNFDGLNDVFKPVFSQFGLDYKTYYMRIFNRWGQLVFETNDPSEGWDGTRGNFADSNPKQDAYNYEIRFSDIEGQTYYRSGAVTIMR